MGNCPLAKRDPYEVFLCIFNTFGDAVVTSLPFQGHIYHTVLVTYDNNGGETEITSTLCYLGYSTNSYQSIFQLKISSLYSFYIEFAKYLLELRHPRGQRLLNF